MAPLVDLMQLLQFTPTWWALLILIVWAFWKLAGYFDGGPPESPEPEVIAGALNGYIDRLEADDWPPCADLRPLLRIASREADRMSRDAELERAA